MKGKFGITLANSTVAYKFDISRNITIIQGDSGTGKTTLINLISSLADNDGSVECNVISSIPELNNKVHLETIAATDRYWKNYIEDAKDTILFFDEKCEFIKTPEFARTIKHSNCYIVLVTRVSLPMLPYSIDEIYTIVEDKRYPKLKKTYNTLVRKYNDTYSKFRPDAILTEDSHSGFQFISKAFSKTHCIPCNGKSNVANMIAACNYHSILAVVDGAAFGPEIENIVTVIRERNLLNRQTEVYTPESFEWLILRSKLFYDKCKNELNETYNYVDSCEYESWKQYYTDLLITITKDTPAAYTKSKLNEYYLGNTAIKSIKEMYDCIIDDSSETMNTF